MTRTRRSSPIPGTALLCLTLLAALPAHATLTYSCDGNIDGAVAGTCNYLNTTLSGFYDAAFNDVNAKVWIRYGNTGLGSSFTALDFAGGFPGSYTTFRNALNADRTSPDDTIFFNSSVPAINPFGTDGVLLTHANSRALGLAVSSSGKCVVGVHAGCTTAGVPGDATFGNCTITVGNYGNTCFDSVITISDSQRTAGALWYRTLSGGSQGMSQYDFFSVVYHESDEILDTISLCCGEQFGFFAPSDLARWTSNGTRSHAFGSNTFCYVPSADNACLSFDGGVTLLVEYNNLNNGLDVGDFATPCTHVQDAFGCQGASFDPSSSVELRLLDVIGYTSAIPEPATISLFGLGLAALIGMRVRRSTR